MIDAYRIGVTIAMSNGVSAVLAVIQKDLLGLKKAVDLTQGGFDRMKLAAAGAAGVFAGTAILGGLYKLQQAGRDFVHQQSLMAQAGISNLDIANATAAAWENASKVRGSNATENLAQIFDLRKVLGDMNEAIAASREMAKINVTLSNITGKPGEQAGYEFARFLEMRGSLVNPQTHQIDPTQLAAQAKLGEAIIAATGGRVDPHQLLMFQQQARVAGMQQSLEGLINLVPLIQAQGGERTGTALTSTSQQLLGAQQLYKHAIDSLEAWGVLDPTKVVKSGGGRFALKDGALMNTPEFRANIADWVYKTLIPQMEAHGLKTMDQQLSAVQASGLRSTVIGLLAELIRNQPAFLKDVNNIKQAAGVDTYAVQQATDPTAKMQAFHEAWTNLLTALGSPMVETVNQIIIKLTNAMMKLTDWAAAHPEIVLQIEKVTAAVAALTVALGATALMAALVSLAGPTGILLAVAAAAALAASDLNKLNDAIQNLLPNWLRQKKDADGKTPMEHLQNGDVQVPWWWPLPAGPGGRAPYSGTDFGHITNDPVGEKMGLTAKPGPTGTPSDPIVVHVQNTGDIASASVGANTRFLTDAATAPRTGPTAPQVRVGPLMPGVPSVYVSP